MSVVVFTGSRSWRDGDPVAQALDGLDRSTVIRHGACPEGLDFIVETLAPEMGFVTDPMPADWRLYGRRMAGLVRNEAMLDKHPRPVRVFAFWDGVSPGTRHCMGQAKRRGIPVERSDQPALF